MPTNLMRPPAQYRIVARDGDAFGVEISIEDTNPTTVTSFVTEAAAGAWIERHKARLLAPPTRGFSRLSMNARRAASRPASPAGTRAK